jgi:Sec-independent protein secretion pathway component TatC
MSDLALVVPLVVLYLLSIVILVAQVRPPTAERAAPETR